jgi:hypothetical protein
MGGNSCRCPIARPGWHCGPLYTTPSRVSRGCRRASEGAEPTRVRSCRSYLRATAHRSSRQRSFRQRKEQRLSDLEHANQSLFTANKDLRLDNLRLKTLLIKAQAALDALQHNSVLSRPTNTIGIASAQEHTATSDTSVPTSVQASKLLVHGRQNSGDSLASTTASPTSPPIASASPVNIPMSCGTTTMPPRSYIVLTGGSIELKQYCAELTSIHDEKVDEILALK